MSRFIELLLRTTEKSKYKVSWFERWMLKRIAKRITTQSPWHEANISYYFWVIERAARDEFNEDNDPTLNDFLDECHDRARDLRNAFKY